MCVICAEMSGQLRRSSFLGEDQLFDRSVSAQERPPSLGPLAFLDLDERGGTAWNGKISFTTTEAAQQLTRDGASWSFLGQAATVTYAFRGVAPGTMPGDTGGFTAFNAAQIVAAELMLLAWADVARITFVRSGAGTDPATAYSSNAAILFGNYASGMAGASAFAYYPGNTSPNSVAGDVWVNSSVSANANPQFHANGYGALLHECGHAIGLAHPGNYDATSGQPINYHNNAQYYEDSRQYSVMSYFNEVNTGADYSPVGPDRRASAPQLDDIAAAQRLYGANMTTRTGDTVYGFNSNTDRLWYSAGSQAAPQVVIFAVWDAGGIDTFDFQYYGDGGVIDLRQGHFSSVGGLTGNVAIAVGAVIEIALGGSGSERIIGNAAANVLHGGGGNDQVDGGLGSDTAIFSGNLAQYVITVGTELVQGVTYGLITVSGPDGTDTLRNVEFLQFADQTVAAPALTAGILLEGDITANTIMGTTFADWLFGADGIDTLSGGAGDDRLAGGRGSDTLNGGDGLDEADFSGATGGVSVNLAAGTAAGTGADGTDTLSGIENLRGSAYADTLVGDGAANVIRGGGGIDLLNGEGGNDILIAGIGVMVGASDLIKGSGVANTTMPAAVNVDANFDLVNDPGVVNATTVPHAVVNGTASGGGLEYYSFTVEAGAACLFDIVWAGFDTVLEIFDSAGVRVAINDDDGGSQNSLINHTFATGGVYYVAVGKWVSGTGATLVSGSPTHGSTYVLNISIPGHTFVAATGVGSALNGGDGDDTLFGAAGDDVLNGGGGADRIEGGDGWDEAIFSGKAGDYSILDNGHGYRVKGADGSDYVVGVELLRFDDKVIDLTLVVCDPFTGAIATTGDAPLVLPGASDVFGKALSAGKTDPPPVLPAAPDDDCPSDHFKTVLVTPPTVELDTFDTSQVQWGLPTEWQSAESRDALLAALETFDGRDLHGFRWGGRNTADQLGDGLDYLSPLVQPAEMGPKIGLDGPIICGSDDAGPSWPFALLMDTETVLAGRELQTLLFLPTANDWVM